MSVAAAPHVPPRPRIAPPRAYVTAISLGGLAVLALVLATGGTSAHARPEVWLFTALAVAGELRPIKVVRRGAEGEITLSTTFTFALLLSAGIGPAVTALALASFVA